MNSLLTEPTVGTVRAVGATAPDPYDGVRHALRADGTVARRGTTYVHANDPALAWDLDAPLAHLVSEVREVWSEHVENHYRTRHGARGGTSSLDLTRMADLILAGTDVPRMLGTEAVSWEEVVTVPVGATIQELSDLATALHLNYSDPWDAAREVFGLSKRPNTPGAVGCHHQVITRPSVTRHAPRRTVTMGRKRLTDPVDSFGAPSESAPSYCHAFGVTHLVAPAHDREHRFVGHVLVRRPPVAAKRRSIKRATVRQARTVTLTPDKVTTHAESMAPGTRTRFTMGALSGTLSRSERGAWSVRVKRDDGKVTTRSTLRQARYVASVLHNAAR